MVPGCVTDVLEAACGQQWAELVVLTQQHTVVQGARLSLVVHPALQPVSTDQAATTTVISTAAAAALRLRQQGGDGGNLLQGQQWQ